MQEAAALSINTLCVIDASESGLVAIPRDFGGALPGPVC